MRLLKPLSIMLMPLAAIACFACSNDDPDSSVANILTVVPSVTFDAEAEGESEIITVQTDADHFNLKYDETLDWFRIVKSASEFTFTVTILSDNIRQEQRTADVEVTAGNAPPAKFTIIQQGYTEPFFEIDIPSITYFDYSGSAGRTYTVRTNIPAENLTATPYLNANWYTIEFDLDGDKQSLVIKVSEYTEPGAIRESFFEIKSDYPGLEFSQEIYITQYSKEARKIINSNLQGVIFGTDVVEGNAVWTYHEAGVELYEEGASIYGDKYIVRDFFKSGRSLLLYSQCGVDVMIISDTPTEMYSDFDTRILFSYTADPASFTAYDHHLSWSFFTHPLAPDWFLNSVTGGSFPLNAVILVDPSVDVPDVIDINDDRFHIFRIISFSVWEDRGDDDDDEE